MANASRAALAAEHIFTALRGPTERELNSGWHGSRYMVAEPTEDDMWAVVEGDQYEPDDESGGDDADDDEDWDWDDDDDDDDWN